MSDFRIASTFKPVGYFEPKDPRPTTEPPALLLAESPVEVGARSTFLSRLTREEYRQVREAGREIAIGAGESVFCQGDPHDGIFLIGSGSVRTFYTGPSGREITLAYWTPGHFVGGPEIFGGGSHIWSGVAVQRSRVLHLHGADLHRLMTRLPGLAMGVVAGLVQKGKCYSALVQMLGTRSVVERLAQLLLILAEKEGREDDTGIVIRRALTHEDLANMVGSTRQWVTSSLQKFQKQGLISMGEKRITLIDPHSLRDIAGSI